MVLWRIRRKFPQGIAEIIVSKHRNGPVDDIKLNSVRNGEIFRFRRLHYAIFSHRIPPSPRRAVTFSSKMNEDTHGDLIFLSGKGLISAIFFLVELVAYQESM
jgi:hypothetical protein